MSILRSESGGVLTLTLSRPERLNSLTFEIYRQLTDTFEGLSAERRVRAVVLTGAGRAFSTGGDVGEIIGPLLQASHAERLDFTRLTCRLIRAIRAYPRPVVASLNGVVAGAGAAIALAADFRIAADTARIAFLFVKVGLSGADMGAAYLLPRLVGLGRATELLMTGEFISAAEAQRIGLYNRVVSPADLSEETSAFVEALASGPAAALAATKTALEKELSMDLATALDEEARVQAELMDGADFREGYAAFQERRPPRFSVPQ